MTSPTRPCVYCREAIPAKSPSDDFCGEFCQAQWMRAANEVTLWDPDDHLSMNVYLGWNRWC